MVQYGGSLDDSFAALADPTRRAVLTRLGRRDATITDLADAFDMTLTGMRKHVRILEDAGLVCSVKVGRTRTCSIGPRALDDVALWIARYRQTVEARFDALEALLARTPDTT